MASRQLGEHALGDGALLPQRHHGEDDIGIDSVLSPPSPPQKKFKCFQCCGGCLPAVCLPASAPVCACSRPYAQVIDDDTRQEYASTASAPSSARGQRLGACVCVCVCLCSTSCSCAFWSLVCAACVRAPTPICAVVEGTHSRTLECMKSGSVSSETRGLSGNLASPSHYQALNMRRLSKLAGLEHELNDMVR